MTAEASNVIDLATVQAGEIPARCWESLQRVKGWSVFVRPEGVSDDDGAA